MNRKKGITLISLVITIIVLLILVGIVIFFSANSNFIGRAKDTAAESIVAGINTYVDTTKSVVILNKSLTKDNVVGLFVQQVEEDNAGKSEEEQYEVDSPDEVNKTVIIRKDGVEVVVDLKSIEMAISDVTDIPIGDIEDRYIVLFKYKEGEEVLEKRMVVLGGSTLQQYLTDSGDSIPKEGVDWIPSLVLGAPAVNENRVYREYIDTSVFYSVAFNLAGGNIGGNTTIPPVEVREGEMVTNPGSPVRTHYTFAGWSPAITTVIVEDTTFTAQWTPVIYTYTFNLNGGNIGGVTANQTTSGAYNTMSYTPANPTRVHYTFSGWSPAVPGTFIANNTYTAQWTVVTYTYTFNLNGGNIGGSTANQTTSGAYNTTSYTPADPLRANHTFAGWAPVVPSTFTGNNTYTALWMTTLHTITYNLNGGNIGGSTANQTMFVAQGEMPPDLKPIKAGYALIGWSPRLAEATSDQTYTAIWSVPMILEMKKATVGAGVVIPIEFDEGSFVYISNNGGDYVQYKSNNPILTNAVSAGTSFTVSIAGRIDRFNYGGRTSTERAQLYRIVDWGELGTTSFNNSFYGCNSLIGPLPSPSKTSFVDVTDFTSAFHGCTSLNGSIPGDLFADCPYVTTFKSTFYSCSSLSGGIPAGLFDYCPDVKVFNNTFGNCTSLRGTIPTGLFDYCPSVADFGSTFYNCGGIRGNIPATLFSSCRDVQSFYSTFQGCSGFLGSIPGALFAYCREATNFSYTFYNCSGLTGTISSTLFTNCAYVTTFSRTFYNCSGLTGSIPGALFNKNGAVLDFSGTFANCTSLTGGIPAALFSSCPSVTTFYTTFSNCTGLTTLPATLFDSNLSARNFVGTFYKCTNLTGMAMGLWNRTPAPDGEACFFKCEKLTNYPFLPGRWGSDYSGSYE